MSNLSILRKAIKEYILNIILKIIFGKKVKVEIY